MKALTLLEFKTCEERILSFEDSQYEIFHKYGAGCSTVFVNTDVESTSFYCSDDLVCKLLLRPFLHNHIPSNEL